MTLKRRGLGGIQRQFETFLKIHLFCITQLQLRNSLRLQDIRVVLWFRWAVLGVRIARGAKWPLLTCVLCNCCKIYLRCASCVSCFQLQLAVSFVICHTSRTSSYSVGLSEILKSVLLERWRWTGT